MRQTAVSLAKSYTPMIKFVGGKHPLVQHPNSATPHPCTIDGMLPGSKECVPVAEYLGKLKLFEVVPYKTKKSPQKSAGTTKGSAYTFTSRPLKENEVDSIFDLPPRFQLRPFAESEIESINAGGAL
ncbi:LAME_0H20846g1_1 [Lachancea meyersii CBS 8951]|uniref:LAME_0H20846g1_1 n=1 Tax=Lachancea meyersii CBS 8951 TaxID=1266667 RepID=A0A1G4KK39_9SACH|nr:LAME_0H20846g1_1 [Lachancea meyersii CBS 8951]